MQHSQGVHMNITVLPHGKSREARSLPAFAVVLCLRRQLCLQLSLAGCPPTQHCVCCRLRREGLPPFKRDAPDGIVRLKAALWETSTLDLAAAFVGGSGS